ncbi:unnamed protein product [Ilex paraguariensis]|uniref:Uncharacterized protein n=1 Tax=Ilex paraguariensis TaxID=185542 RepID=A0ABC8UVQ9_9AQUA
MGVKKVMDSYGLGSGDVILVSKDLSDTIPASKDLGGAKPTAKCGLSDDDVKTEDEGEGDTVLRGWRHRSLHRCGLSGDDVVTEDEGEGEAATGDASMLLGDALQTPDWVLAGARCGPRICGQYLGVEGDAREA